MNTKKVCDAEIVVAWDVKHPKTLTPEYLATLDDNSSVIYIEECGLAPNPRVDKHPRNNKWFPIITNDRRRAVDDIQKYQRAYKYATIGLGLKRSWPHTAYHQITQICHQICTEADAWLYDEFALLQTRVWRATEDVREAVRELYVAYLATKYSAIKAYRDSLRDLVTVANLLPCADANVQAAFTAMLPVVETPTNTNA